MSMSSVPPILTSVVPAGATQAPGQAAPVAVKSDAPARFHEALAQALEAQAQIKSGDAAAAAAQTADEAKTRARRGLNLPEGSQTGVQNGDAVLNGLQTIRGIFDRQIGTLAAASVDVGSSEGLFKAQLAAANFSIFMEVGSKLAGKTSQAFESLLKGQ